MAKKDEFISVNKINVSRTKVTIIGDGDLCLNKMNDVAARILTDQRKDKAKTLNKPNMWEEVITALHWRDGKPKDFSEEGLYRALNENAPCISAFGLKKSWGDAVVRNAIDKYKTKFDASINIISTGGVVPIKFSNYTLDEKLMSPKKGSPVLVHISRFSGWSAEVEIAFTENTYSLEQIVNIINLAGFGIGIGSGRSSGYGRYHVETVE